MEVDENSILQKQNILRQKKKICIFCMGEFGLDLYFKLREYDIHVDYFGDNNREKWGYALDNVYCYSMEELLKQKDELLIIVAKKNPNDLVKKLGEQGFNEIITRESVLDMLGRIPASKSTIEEEYIQSLDYSKPEYINMIEQFRDYAFNLINHNENHRCKVHGKEFLGIQDYFNNVLENLYLYNEGKKDENR